MIINKRKKVFNFKISSSITKIGLCFSFLFLCVACNAQTNDGVENTPKEKEVEVIQTVREELHRYTGYEELFPKYISLPYDVTMNTNISGAFVDIGYLLLMFLPILFFTKIKNGLLKLFVGGAMILFLVISISTGYSAREQIPLEQVTEKLEQEMNAPTQSTVFSPIKRGITRAAYAIYMPLKGSVIDTISGEGDAFTYPFLFLMFCIFGVIAFQNFRNKPKGEKALLLFFLLYSFLWLILGAGILWYGILLIPMGIIFINSGMLNKFQTNIKIKYILGVFSFIWIITSLTYRFSNYSLPPTNAELSRGAIHPAPLLYGTGEKSEAELLEFLYPSYSPVLKQINTDPAARVYRIGTFFHYFISRNNERVFQDNQLGYFNVLQNQNPDKIKLAEYLKKVGYKYIIFDLNTASMDQTPEGSLRKKVAKFEDFMNNNPAIELIGTDAIVLDRNGRQINSIYGTKLIKPGKFVVFRIK